MDGSIYLFLNYLTIYLLAISFFLSFFLYRITFLNSLDYISFLR